MSYDHIIDQRVDVRRSDIVFFAGTFRKFGSTYLVETHSNQSTATYKHLEDGDTLLYEGQEGVERCVYRKSSSSIA